MALIIAGCGRLGFGGFGGDGSDDPDGAPGTCRPGEAQGTLGVCIPGVAVTPDLVAYWPLDEVAGSSGFADLSGNGNVGSCTACPASGLPGIRGRAVEFTAAARGINVGGGSRLTGITQAITVAAWVYLTAYSQFGYILSNERDCDSCGNYAGFSLWATHYAQGPALQVRDGDSTSDTAKAGAPIPLGQWQFVAGVYDGSMLRVWVGDRVVRMQPSVAGGLSAPPSHQTRIGAMGFDSTRGIDALVDEVMVFDRALTDNELAELHDYYRGLPP